MKDTSAMRERRYVMYALLVVIVAMALTFLTSQDFFNWFMKMIGG